MKQQAKVESVTICGNSNQMTPQPSLPPPLPRSWARHTAAGSVTKTEIATFWKQRQIEEEEHLLAAIKAAARIRARNLSGADYKRFEESLMIEHLADKEPGAISGDAARSSYGDKNQELRVGIKDWWTKSKYAYLNLPALESKGPSKWRASSYTPNRFPFSLATPLYPTSLSVV